MQDSEKEPNPVLVDKFGRPIRSQTRETVGHRAKRNFKNISAYIIGASVLVAAIVTLLVNFDALCERFCPPDQAPGPNLEEYFVADYWRMTGAVEVPFFLLEGPNIARCTDPNAIDINRANCEYSGKIGEVWRTELNGALLVDDGVIDQTNIMSGLREIWFASTAGHEVVDAIYCSIMAMDGGIQLTLENSRRLSRATLDVYLGKDIQSDRLLSPVSENPDCSVQYGKEIGYLILRLRNATDTPITNIQVSFRNFASSGPLGPDRKTNDLLLESIRNQNPSDFDQWLVSNQASDLFGVISAASIEQRRLPDLLPGNSMLVPIHSFRANEEGFEDYFYKDWRLPAKISFDTGGEDFNASVPFPGRNAAAVVRTFNGWYQQ